MTERKTHTPTDRSRHNEPGPVGRFFSTLGKNLRRALGLSDGRCPCCSRLVHGTLLCPECAARLVPRRTGFCPHCGMIFENAHQPPTRCGACRLSPRPWDRVFFHGVHEDLLRELIIQWKYGRSPVHSGLLERLAVDAATGAQPDANESAPRESSNATDSVRQWDAVVPVPLHPRRLRWRGFNQSLELARAVARHTGAELLHRGLTRTRETVPQTELSGSERKRNIKGAFAADKAKITSKRVLLVDDVLTTGATLEECARTLNRAGAVSIDVLVLARARGD